LKLDPDSEKSKNLAPKAYSLVDLIDYQASSVVSRTILDKRYGTVTLFAFGRGEGLSEHTTPFDAMVYILEGEADISISSKHIRLTKGKLITMPANEPHALSAVTQFKMLLILIRS
jgi:quercetin dioxygenase-like cupin family protein